MGGHSEKTGSICFKKMRGDNLKRHMEKHKILEKAKNNHVSICSIDKEEVEKEMFNEQQEFKRKLELGEIVNNYMNKNEIERAALSKDKVEALGIYETHGKKTKSRGNNMERMAKGFKKIFR